MQVQLFPNRRAPGVGLRPRREAQRPFLPQHARHCPVLEAGSTLGYLCYPPLQPTERFHIGYEGEGRYRFVYQIRLGGRPWERVFTIAIALPVGSIGVFKEELAFSPGVPTTAPEVAAELMRRFVVTDDLGTPSGAVTLTGAWNFKTQPGWDTVYGPVVNAIERPVAPMLVVRVETDWYVHESEFRYVLQVGEQMSVEHNMPIGQVFFIPRETVTLRDSTDDEVVALQATQDQFFQEKSRHKLATPYGLSYSTHYLRTSRQQASGVEDRVEGDSGGRERNRMPPAALDSMEPVRPPLIQPVTLPPLQAARSIRVVGRNDVCPCGSGKKYKKCHGH